ncbi:MAG: PDZ domain-containing protein [Coriobacteriia bacterium]|nr:PDZ domain-containing protein [Coriobacteriia bacterium]
MNKATKAILAVSLTIIVGSLGFIGGFATSRILPADSPLTTVVTDHVKAPTTVSGRVDEVYELMKKRALVVPAETSATAGAVEGLLQSNGDKYATYFDDTHFKAFNEDSMGSFGGIGVVLGEKDGTTYITEVYKGTPAGRAGLLPGDEFRVIDGTRRTNWQTTDVVKKVRGEVGTKVTITLYRPKKGTAHSGTEKEFTLTRATINYPNLKSEMIDGVGYMRLGQFNANAESDVAKAIASLTKKGAKSLILDLRSDPGGLLDEAVSVSSLFIKDGVIVRVDERGKPEDEIKATGRKMTDLPLVVLIDGDSASASEITAGALQDYGRATLVGEKSYGKGSVQTVEAVSWGGGVKFTIAHYLTPKKRVINGKGLTPDVVVKMDRMDQVKRSTDIQLKKAVEIARQKTR